MEYRQGMKKFDKSKVLAGYDFFINDKISIHNPKVGEVIEFGESEYFNVVHALCSIPSDFKSMLFDSGIDYEKISDFDLFIMITRGLKKEDTKLVFNDLDLSKFEVDVNSQNSKRILVDHENKVVLDEYIYISIMEYLRTLHGIKPKIEKAANEWTKKALIEDDRVRIKMRKEKDNEPFLYGLMLSAINTEEFKYNSETIKNITLFELFESISQIQHKKSAMALLQGSYSGMLDMSKVDKKKDLSWIKV